MKDERSILSALLDAIRHDSLSGGVEKLDQILALQGQFDADELQEAYVRGILLLVGRNPDPTLAGQLNDRLGKTPAYNQDEKLIQEHGRALARAAGLAAVYKQALQTAQSVQSLRGYGASQALQAAHAEALFQASEKPGADIFEVTRQLSEIPSFRDSVEIQFAAARALCNYTGRAANQRKLDKAIDALQKLPRLAEDASLQESLEKAKRNRERFLELKAEKSGRGAWKGILVGGGVLAGLVAGAFFLFPSKKVEAKSTPVPVAVESTSPKEAEFEKFLDKSDTAYQKGNYEDAFLYAGMSLKRANALNDVDGQARCYDLLASSALHRGDQGQLELLDKIPQSYLPTLGRRHLEIAQKHDQDGQSAQLSNEISYLIHLSGRATKSALDPTLEQSYLICEKRELWKLGGLIQVRLGNLELAADLAEKSEDYELAEKLIRQMAEKTPEGKERLSQFLKKRAAGELVEADQALATKQFEEAESIAKSALQKLRETKGGKEQNAAAYTVLAKAAYLKGDYREAVAQARKAYHTAPNSDRKQRLASYKFKDASVVTLDELDVDTFVFPPAEKTDKFYTYFYYLCNAYQGPQEELFQLPKDDITVSSAYGRPDRGVTIRVRSYTGKHFSADFDADRKRPLTPGLYKDATRFPFNNNNPGIDFSGNGTGHNTSRGKFQVHEIEFQGNKLSKLAVDFIFEGQSSVPRPVFGKIRYNSHYR